MSKNVIYILFLLLFPTTISCGQSLNNQIYLTIEDDELGLVFYKEKRIVLDSGEHKINKDSEVFLFRKTDSLTTKEFDILDINAKSLYCQIKVKYLLTTKHIENIADLLKWTHNIKQYQELVIIPQIMSEIRTISENYEAKILKNEDSHYLNEIKKLVSDGLEKYANIISLELKIFEK